MLTRLPVLLVMLVAVPSFGQDHDHDKFGTLSIDIDRRFTAFTVSFDSADDDGDELIDVWAIPYWVAYEIDRPEGILGKEPNPLSMWSTDDALFKPQIASNDASYHFSQNWRERSPTSKFLGCDRGHMSMKLWFLVNLPEDVQERVKETAATELWPTEENEQPIQDVVPASYASEASFQSLPLLSLQNAGGDGYVQNENAQQGARGTEFAAAQSDVTPRPSAPTALVSGFPWAAFATVVAALIAFLGGIIALVVKFFVMQPLLDDRQKQRDIELAELTRRHQLEDLEMQRLAQRRDIVRLYAEPLLDSLTRLHHRLDEIVKRPGRAGYLKSDAPETSYNKHKYISTAYRLSAVLGWIQAFRRERSLLDPKAARDDEIERQITSLQNNLADGDHIELHRLQELARLWGVTNSLPDNPTKLSRLAVAIEKHIHRVRSDKAVLAVPELPVDEQKELCRTLASLISERTSAPISQECVENNLSEAMHCLGIREWWLYRDWQAAIGDFMLDSTPAGSERRFEVMGYGRYEALHSKLAIEDDMKRAEHPWIERVLPLFLDLDVKDRVFDARHAQVKTLHNDIKILRMMLLKRLEALNSPHPNVEAPRHESAQQRA